MVNSKAYWCDSCGYRFYITVYDASDDTKILNSLDITVDAYTQKVARKLNRCLYLPTVEFKAKKIVDDPTAQKVRGNLNINNRDAYVWNKVKDQHLDTDVKKLQEFIDNFKK